MELIWCPPGGFVMGPSGEDSPAHPVILTKGFYLGKYEVTQEEYEKVTSKKANFKKSSKFKGAKLPVEMVSWNGAVAFCEALNKKEKKRGWKFSLPTEAQWEYACRAGTTTNYSWGKLPKVRYANYNHNPVKKNLGIKKTVEVGSYSSNPQVKKFFGYAWQCLGMDGGLARCLSEKLSYRSARPSNGSSRVLRGGSWDNSGMSLRSAHRGTSNPSYRRNNIGFRVALKQVD